MPNARKSIEYSNALEPMVPAGFFTSCLNFKSVPMRIPSSSASMILFNALGVYGAINHAAALIPPTQITPKSLS